MRLFLAVLPDQKMKNALLALQADLRRQGVRGRYPGPGNLHLTLTFIGEYPDPARVLRTLQSVPYPPFSVKIGEPGRFGDLFWAGLTLPDPAFAYVARLRRARREAGIPFDSKPFAPHVTLLRQADRPLPRLIAPEAEMNVRRVSLMRSERGERGMIYTEIGAAAPSPSAP